MHSLKEELEQLIESLYESFEKADEEYTKKIIKGCDFILLSNGATESEVHYQKLGKAGAYYDSLKRLIDLYEKFFD